MGGVFYALKRALETVTVTITAEKLKIADASDVIINPATKENQQEVINRLPSSLTPSGNFKVSVEEAGIVTPVDVQARLNEHGSQTISSPSASTTYNTNSVDASLAAVVTFYVIADQPLDVQVQVSFDGSTWHDLVGFSIASADFQANKANNIHVTLRAPYYRLSITTGSTPPSSIQVHWVVGR